MDPLSRIMERIRGLQREELPLVTVPAPPRRWKTHQANDQLSSPFFKLPREVLDQWCWSKKLHVDKHWSGGTHELGGTRFLTYWPCTAPSEDKSARAMHKTPHSLLRRSRYSMCEGYPSFNFLPSRYQDTYLSLMRSCWRT
jgi:hypothetical protein